MRLADVDILIVPGHRGLCDDHWQSRWLAKLSSASLIEPGRATSKDIGQWAARIVAQTGRARKPVVLVAHGSGIAAVMHAIAELPAGKVVGAFLVAVQDDNAITTCDPQQPSLNGLDASASAEDGKEDGKTQGNTAETAKLPLRPLPFPSILVASSNCPTCSMARAKTLADAWGSTLVEAGDSGSIDAQSGHGPWPEGLMRFGAFLKSLG